jgi:hypothetical protein
MNALRHLLKHTTTGITTLRVCLRASSIAMRSYRSFNALPSSLRDPRALRPRRLESTV